MTSHFETFVGVSQHFLNLIVEETRYLTSHDLESALSLLPEKQRMSQIHQEHIKTFTEEQGWEKASVDQLMILKPLLDALREALVKNQQALKLVHAVQEGLVTKIKDVICQYQAPVCHYSKDKRRTANQSPVSLSVINRSI